jgi:hypothetical protein
MIIRMHLPYTDWVRNLGLPEDLERFRFAYS